MCAVNMYKLLDIAILRSDYNNYASVDKNAICAYVFQTFQHLRWSQGVITDIFSESKLRLLNL